MEGKSRNGWGIFLGGGRENNQIFGWCWTTEAALYLLKNRFTKVAIVVFNLNYLILWVLPKNEMFILK